MPKSRLLSSAKIVCNINGISVGRVKSFRWSSNTPKRKILGLDCATPFELAPTISEITGSLALWRTVLDGGVEGIGMAAQSSQMIRERYFTLTLVDRSTGAVVFRAQFCSVENQSWDIPERGLIQGVVNFSGLHWNNECRPSSR